MANAPSTRTDFPHMHFANSGRLRPRAPAATVCAVLGGISASLIGISFWLPGPEVDNTGTGDEIGTAVTPSRTVSGASGR